MDSSLPVKAVAAAVAVGGLVAASAAPTVGALAPSASEPAAQVSAVAKPSAAAPPQHEHSERTYPAQGRFVCGSLRLTVIAGTETETFDGDLRRGVARVSISRIGNHVRLRGSDGRTYRAASVVIAWDVLRAPDFDNPVRGLEVIQVVFRGGPRKSPGYLREKITFRHGHERDVVYGPCDYA